MSTNLHISTLQSYVFKLTKLTAKVQSIIKTFLSKCMNNKKYGLTV